jgi:hypothetical protein
MDFGKLPGFESGSNQLNEQGVTLEGHNSDANLFHNHVLSMPPSSGESTRFVPFCSRLFQITGVEPGIHPPDHVMRGGAPERSNYLKNTKRHAMV